MLLRLIRALGVSIPCPCGQGSYDPAAGRRCSACDAPIYTRRL